METLIWRSRQGSICLSCARRLLGRSAITTTPHSRNFSSTTRKHADETIPPSALSSSSSSPPPPPSSLAKATYGAAELLAAMGNPAPTTQSSSDSMLNQLRGLIDSSAHSTSPRNQVDPEPHHLHVYATKHNTHITLTKPNKDPLISMSAGNLGFRKSNRGSYDAAFQLAAYVMRTMQERGLLRYGHDSSGIEAIDKLSVVFRGFGVGRDAVSKALLGSEGRRIRDRVVEVSDGTRLKFGGTRSPKPRRLG